MRYAAQAIFFSIAAITLLNASSNKEDLFAGKSTSISVPVVDAQKRVVRVADKIQLDKVHPLAYRTILRTGMRLNGETFGLLKDENDQPLREEDGSPYICNGQYGGSGPDHTELIEKDGKIFMITQFECRVGAVYQAELAQDPKTGDLKAKNLKYISQKGFHGGWVHCAGMKTPWNSFLGSEEYEPNARDLDKATGKIDTYYNVKAAYFGGDLKKSNPYYYGWITEIKILNGNGDDLYDKHYSMGRFSHELAYIMPDKKTAYFGDDGTNCALFMYIADKAGNLSAGTLYAAKWNQTSSVGGGSANLKWIKLGHATDSEIKAIVDNRPYFDDIFNAAKVKKDGSCPTGFTSINTRAGHECLAVKPGKDQEAAFLESRRYAAMKGATTEFRKMEGITYDPDLNKVYIAISQIAKGMEDNKKYGKDNDKYDKGGHNNIRLSYNKCGAVYAFDLEKSAISDYTPKNMHALIAGKPKKYDANSPYANNSCDINSIASPDNITYLTGKHILLIGEDTSYHQNDYIWEFNTKTGKLQDRLATTPYGSETTSAYWEPNIGGFNYINFVTQHPYGETDEDKKRGPDDVQSYVGYIQVK